MLYTVKHGDTLYRISKRFGASMQSILTANVLCDPDVLYVGDVLILPRPGFDLPRAGGGPYYVVRPGDTLDSISQEFKVPVNTLASNNQLPNTRLVMTGSEILVIPDNIPETEGLTALWETTGVTPCEALSDQTIHDVYYSGTFHWAALGLRAIPHLLGLLKHPSKLVRQYSVISLGRIGIDRGVKTALQNLLSEPDKSVSAETAAALKRIQLAEVFGKRVHILETAQTLVGDLNTHNNITILPACTSINVLRWHIPSPRTELSPDGQLQIYDYVQVLETGRLGFLPRAGFKQIQFI